MSERVLSEERPIDEGISTATLAGMNDRTTLNGERDLVERDEVRDNEEMSSVPDDLNTRGTIADRTASQSPATAQSVQRNGTSEEQSAPLFPGNEAKELHSRWYAIQVGFVDEPRQAVEQADALVAGAMKRMAEIFAEERARLEGQWDRGDNVSTEDLRQALRRYRSFFGRVLSV